MLLLDAALSYLHFVFALILAGALAAEAFILRLPVDGRIARLLLRVDLFYGISAAGVIGAGVARVIWGATGWEFYSAQPFFWAKMAVFLVIGLISALPTRQFMAWVKAANGVPGYTVPEADAARMRRLVMIELHLLALVPLFAALMARGIGS